MSDRGVYGVPDRRPPAQDGGSWWWKLAALIGAGATARYILWPMWKRRQATKQLVAQAALAAPDPVPAVVQAPPAAPVIEAPAVAPVPSPYVSSFHPLEAYARDRGFSTVADYENSALASARQLAKEGATVTFAPHLSHLNDLVRSKP